MLAASLALSGPAPIPNPIKATPESFKVFFTSAKSRLITAGKRIKLTTVLTDWANTLSPSPKALPIGLLPSIISNLSLLTTIIASTLAFKLFKPSTERAIRFLPSKANGLVTIATTNAPASFAMRAITGDAPVPVPPPIPAAIKTMLASLTISLISSALASAAFLPISGSPPAPSPPVISAPRTKRFLALLVERVCLSVFAT
ncbi:hypothetical protein SDC9_163766 [bioreactor metagenome]|uniref:Uncharacterized protein n=1 Tax=bioreactor metagenome TaxID=1076179 RepID=A0A645FRT5_9ZZZZ